MPDSEFSVNLTADVSDLTDKMDSAKESVQEAADTMKAAGESGGSGFSEAMEGMGEAMGEFKEKADGMLENLTAMAGGWTGLLSVMGAGAIGELFEHIAETTIELGNSLRETSATLNVSTSDARGFLEAMESLGIAPNAAAQAIRRLEMDASNGGKSLARLGVSATEASGEMKSGEEIFLEVVEKLNNLTDANQRAEAGFTLLGRGAAQILGHLEQIPGAVEESTAAQRQNTDANIAAVDGQAKLSAALTELHSHWEDDIVKMGPLVEGALLGIQRMLDFDANTVNVLTTALSKLGSAWQQLVSIAGQLPLGEGEGSQGGPAVHPTLGIDNAGLDMRGYNPDAAAHTLEGGAWAPKPVRGGGGGGRGGGGGADPMAGMDDTLISSQVEMNKLAAEFQKLGSESQMAAKASESSFADLRAKAVEDYQQMMTAHKAFADAVQKGDAEAAKASEKDWKDASKEFQADWDQARARATQDIQQIKSAADQMASEVSGILNGAISGKLNWAQEFQKILSQMLDHLLKHLAQQVAMWAANEMQVNAIKSAGLTAGLAEQKAANAAAGTSDAVTAAKGAYSSAAQIPYIGWIIAPVAAAAAFSGVEAFGSAEGGYDVPIGQSPMIQAHPRELVMPSNLADGFRDIIRNGGGRGGGNSTTNMHIQSLDPSKLADIVMRNPEIFAQAAAQHRRNGGRFATG